MNLAWLAAVFVPEEIGPLIDRDPRVDQRPEADLAALITGRSPSWHKAPWEGDKGSEASVDTALELLEKSLQWDESGENLDSTASYLQAAEASENPARYAALTIAICPLLAERELYNASEELLRIALAAVSEGGSANDLFRAALLQQRALRRRDTDGRFLDDSVEALRLLRRVDTADCTDFTLSTVSDSSPQAVAGRIVELLGSAIWSLIPTREFIDPNRDGTPPPNDLPRIYSWSPDQLKVRGDESEQYGRWLGDLYNFQLERAAVTTIGRAQPDLFYQSYMYELMGHQAVYGSRKNLAMMRILASMPRLLRRDMSDCIRLLRHSGSENELVMLLNRLTRGGPLDALASDTRQIVHKKARGADLRTFDMFVLQAGADLLSESEASEVLDDVFNTIASGGPSVGPGRYQVRSKRQLSAWMAAAALGETAGASSIVASQLLVAIRSDPKIDDLWDLTFAGIIRRIDWTTVVQTVAEDWREYTRENMGSHTEAIQALQREFNLYPDQTNIDLGSPNVLDDIANLLDRDFRTETVIQPSDASRFLERVKQMLNRIQRDAVSGRYAAYAMSHIELAALLFNRIVDDIPSNWRYLLAFLTDSRLPRSDRTLGFEVLTDTPHRIPDDIADEYRTKIASAIESRDIPWVATDRSFTPYPAAIRFAFRHKLISNDDAFIYVTQLLSTGIPAATEEAARTISSFAQSSQQEWIQTFAVQLSLDPNPTVRAQVLRALVVLADSPSGTQSLATTRIIDLLGDDGIVVPLETLREVMKMTRIPDAVYPVARSMQATHVSKRVRTMAAKVAAT
jgi:hypothetical protein